MRTLILSGSPRKHGDTAALLGAMLEHLQGEVVRVDAYGSGIAACIDCRYCWEHPGCAVTDGMQEIYEQLDTFDNVIIASPLYMSTLTPPLLGIASRLQVYYAAKHFRGETLVHRRKRGVLILAGGGDGGKGPAVDAAGIIFRHFKAGCVAEAASLRTNRVPAKEDMAAIEAARAAALLLNKG